MKLWINVLIQQIQHKLDKHKEKLQLFVSNITCTASRGKMASSLGNMELMNNLTKIVQS